MGMSKIEELQEQKCKWDMLINDTEQAKKRTLATMIQLRRELGSMSDLKKQYPNSDTINDRIKKCDQLLEQSTEILENIKNELSGFRQQKEALDQLIEEYTESITSPSNCFR